MSDAVLARIDKASEFLAQATTIDDFKKVMALADAARIFGKRLGATRDAINHAGRIRILSERGLGEASSNLEKHKGGRPNKTGPKTGPVSSYKEIGLDKRIVSRAQMLASIPLQVVENAISAESELQPIKVITQLTRAARESKREDRREENAKAAAVTDDPLKSGVKFSCILLDPPWDWGDEGDINQMGRAKPDYATMSIEQLMKLPAEQLADNDCHLYMWITNRSLPKGFSLLEAWGFRYVTALTWPKPSFGMGNYFRGQTEHILFGVRGSLMLKRKDASTLLPTWKRGPRGHSSKPIEFYEFVESCSPGPYLELFAREERNGWKRWGADA